MASVRDYGKVAVIFGGTSAEREVSLKSGNNVLQGLLAAGIDAIAFDPKEQPLAALVTQGIDRAFIVLHGRGGEDGTIQGALEYLGIPYTGSGVLGSALAMDKVRTKQLFMANQLPTAPFRVVKKNHYQPGNEAQILAELGGVVFVKPAHEGSSIGMNRAADPAALATAIGLAFGHDHTVLIEAFIAGREYTVALLNQRALPAIELRTPRTFYDYEAKYQSDSTEYLCPCDLNDADSQQIQALAEQAFSAIGGINWGRVDVMRDQAGQFYLLEVNTVPGMTAKSLVPMAAKVAGIELQSLLLTILADTLTPPQCQRQG